MRGSQHDSLILKKTKREDAPSLRSFDGVVVGSGIKMMRWVGKTRDFLKKHAKEFKTRGMVLGIFVSAGSASIPWDQPKARKDYIEKVLAVWTSRLTFPMPLGEC